MYVAQTVIMCTFITKNIIITTTTTGKKKNQKKKKKYYISDTDNDCDTLHDRPIHP
jgi:hypothetical protein